MDILFIFISLTTLLQDSSNVRLIGWWPYSNSNTVVTRGDYTYLGSGFGIEAHISIMAGDVMVWK